MTFYKVPKCKLSFKNCSLQMCGSFSRRRILVNETSLVYFLLETFLLQLRAVSIFDNRLVYLSRVSKFVSKF